MIDEYRSINIRDIKTGDLFWECEQGQDALFIATSDAKREMNGVGVTGREIPGGKSQHFFEGDRAGAYGPRLYAAPQYTRPDYGALLVGLVAVMREEIGETEKQSNAREEGLKLAATQYSESRDHWQAEARRAEQELSRLRRILETVGDIAEQKQNGITLSNRIRAALEAETQC